MSHFVRSPRSERWHIPYWTQGDKGAPGGSHTGEVAASMHRGVEGQSRFGLQRLRSLVTAGNKPDRPFDPAQQTLKEALTFAELAYYARYDQVDKFRGLVKRERIRRGKPPKHPAAHGACAAALDAQLGAAIAAASPFRCFGAVSCLVQRHPRESTRSHSPEPAHARRTSITACGAAVPLTTGASCKSQEDTNRALLLTFSHQRLHVGVFPQSPLPCSPSVRLLMPSRHLTPSGHPTPSRRPHRIRPTPPRRVQSVQPPHRGL